MGGEATLRVALADLQAMQLILPGSRARARVEPGAALASSTTRSGRAIRTHSGVEEEYQLLDGTTFDLVQHIDTVLAAIAGHELEPQINPELMQSVLEIATPVCHTPADVMGELTKLRGYVCNVARDDGDAPRLRRHPPVQPLRATAHHGEGQSTASSSTSCSTSPGES